MNLNSYYDKTSLKNAVSAISYTGGSTNTGWWDGGGGEGGEWGGGGGGSMSSTRQIDGQGGGQRDRHPDVYSH